MACSWCVKAFEANFVTFLLETVSIIVATNNKAKASCVVAVFDGAFFNKHATNQIAVASFKLGSYLAQSTRGLECNAFREGIN